MACLERRLPFLLQMRREARLRFWRVGVDLRRQLRFWVAKKDLVKLYNQIYENIQLQLVEKYHLLER